MFLRVTADRDDRCLQRGLHDIEDELIFTKHDGYVFHDSRGFEAGGKDELQIVQNFVHSKAWERRMEDRLHAIWFVPFGYLQLQLHKAFFPGTAFRWTVTGQI